MSLRDTMIVVAIFLVMLGVFASLHDVQLQQDARRRLEQSCEQDEGQPLHGAGQTVVCLDPHSIKWSRDP